MRVLLIIILCSYLNTLSRFQTRANVTIRLTVAFRIGRIFLRNFGDISEHISRIQPTFPHHQQPFLGCGWNATPLSPRYLDTTRRHKTTILTMTAFSNNIGIFRRVKTLTRIKMIVAFVSFCRTFALK